MSDLPRQSGSADACWYGAALCSLPLLGRCVGAGGPIPLGWALLVAGALTGYAAIRAGRRMHRIAVVRGADRAESGATMVEFILNFPIFMLMFLSIVQITLMGQGAVVTQYAAFSAGRSAIVAMGEDRPGDPRLAAAIALSPVSPRVEGGSLPQELRSAARIIAAQEGRVWSTSRAEEQLAFAYNTVDVAVEQRDYRATFDTGIPEVGPRPYRVTVRHQFKMVIPGVSIAMGGRRSSPAGQDGIYAEIVRVADQFSTGPREAGALTGITVVVGDLFR